MNGARLCVFGLSLVKKKKNPYMKPELHKKPFSIQHSQAGKVASESLMVNTMPSLWAEHLRFGKCAEMTAVYFLVTDKIIRELIQSNCFKLLWTIFVSQDVKAIYICGNICKKEKSWSLKHPWFGLWNILRICSYWALRAVFLLPELVLISLHYNKNFFVRFGGEGGFGEVRW